MKSSLPPWFRLRESTRKCEHVALCIPHVHRHLNSGVEGLARIINFGAKVLT